MRGGTDKDKYILYFKSLAEYSKNELVELAKNIKPYLQYHGIYDITKLCKHIDRQLAYDGDGVHEDYDDFNNYRRQYNEVLDLLLSKRLQPANFNDIIENNIITSIILLNKIWFGILSMKNGGRNYHAYLEDQMNKFKTVDYINAAENFFRLLCGVYEKYTVDTSTAHSIIANATTLFNLLNDKLKLTKALKYKSINTNAKLLLSVVSHLIVYIRNQEHIDVNSSLDKLDNIIGVFEMGEFMRWITQIILISGILEKEIDISIREIQTLMTKAASSRAATRIQAHTRSRRDQKSYRAATMSRAKAKAKAATMSRAATIMQAHHRGNIGRRDARDALIAHEFKLQAEIEKALQEELQAMEAMQ